RRAPLAPALRHRSRGAADADGDRQKARLLRRARLAARAARAEEARRVARAGGTARGRISAMSAGSAGALESLEEAPSEGGASSFLCGDSRCIYVVDTTAITPLNHG